MCFLVCDTFPRITCIFMGLKTFVNEREREKGREKAEVHTIQQDKIMLLVEPFVMLQSGKREKWLRST